MSHSIFKSSSPYLAEIEESFGASDYAPQYWSDQLSALTLDVDSATFTQKLYDLKAQFDLSWANARLEKTTLSDVSHFIALGRRRSEFAAISIDKALHYAWQDTLRANRLKEVPLEGIFVLGLGKLGGHDLNFSSDVDIIAFFDPEMFPVPESKGRKYIANKMLQRMTQILHPKGKPVSYTHLTLPTTSRV